MITRLRRTHNISTMLLLVILCSACQGHREAWKLLLPGESLSSLSINPADGSLGIISTREDYFWYYHGREKLEKEKILIDSPYGILQLCMTDLIWAITSDGVIASYDITERSWVFHRDLLEGPEGVPGCYVTPDNRLILDRANRLIIYGDNKVTIALPSGDPITDVMQDSHGDLWVLTREGLVYKVGTNNEWSLIENFNFIPYSTTIYASSEEDIWIGVWNLLYVWHPGDGSYPMLPILGVPRAYLHENWIIDLFQDESGTMWIVTSEGVWVYRESIPKRDDSPVQSRSHLTYFDNQQTFQKIGDAVFDYKLNRLYISTLEGVYYLNTLSSK